MTPEQLAVAALVILGASVVQGMAGFAFSLISMGVLPGVLGGGREGMLGAITISIVLGNLCNIAQVVQYRGHLAKDRLLPLLLGAAVGLPAGVAVQKAKTPGLLQALGVVMLAFALYQLLRRGEPAGEPLGPRWGYLAGLLGGLLGGALGCAGPPIVVYCALRRWSPDVVRGTQVCFFTFSGLAQLGLYYYNGLIDEPLLRSGLWLIPILPLGLGIGWALARRLDARAFRRMVLVLLACLGARLLLAS